MSRSGYSDCLDSGELNLYRGNVNRAINGKRGQTFFRRLLDALEAMRVKELHPEIFVEGEKCCAMGALAVREGVDDPERFNGGWAGDTASLFNIADCLAAEVAFENDDDFGCRVRGIETPAQRWQRMRDWVARQLREPRA